MQQFFRSAVSVRFCCTVHTAYIRNESHVVSKGARPNETNSNIGQYIARGGIVNHDDLTDALKKGVIRSRSAGRNRTKASAERSSIVEMANVTLTPHFGSAAALKHENENDGAGRDQFTSWLK